MRNEEMVRILGYHDPQDVIGKRFSQAGSEGVIIGVVRDFHARSFHEMIEPLTFRMQKGRYTFFTFSLASDNLNETIFRLKETWSRIVPDLPFHYFFTDDAFNAQYHKEERFARLFVCFAVLGIVLSCLGLVGLSAFSIISRSKEIGIRKILGSSVSSVVRLLISEFVLLIAIACSIGILLGWMGMTVWLSGFAYRINLSWWFFTAPGMIVLLVALLTISFQTISAAQADPVKRLRSG